MLTFQATTFFILSIIIVYVDAAQAKVFRTSDLREYMISNGLDRIVLENKTEEFSEKFVGIKFHGKASLYNGFLTGMESFHRSGPINLYVEGNDTIFDAEVEVNDARLKYSMLVEFMGHGPKATAIGSLKSISVFVKLRVSSGLSNVTLDEFKVLDLGHLSIDVEGLGPLGFIVGVVADVIGNSFTGVVTAVLKRTVKSMVNEIIRDMLFQLNANNTTKWTNVK